MDAESKNVPASLMDIPFKTFCDALRDLRASRSTKSRRGNGAGRVSVAKQHKRERAGFDSTAVATSLESKYDVLTRLWKDVAGQLRNVDAQRLCVDDPESQLEGKGVKMDDVPEEDDEEFRPSIALPVDVTEKLLKLLCPTLDDSHSLYNMKEKKIAEHYVDALSLMTSGSNAQWLMNYADPEKRQKALGLAGSDTRKKRAIGNAVDGVFVSVLGAVLTGRVRNSSDKTLTVGHVWELLTTLHDSKTSIGSKYLAQGHAKYGADAQGDAAAALIPAKGHVEDVTDDPAAQKRRIVDDKKDVRLSVFRVMIRQATATENVEFARLILKDTEVRLREDHLLKWFHPDAKQYHDCTHNLKRLIADVRDPSFSVKNSVGIEPGTPCASMNTVRPTKSNLKKLAAGLATGKEDEGVGAKDSNVVPYFLMEPKFDGERMQLHKIGSRVLTFTRNRKDSTAIYGALLAPAIMSSVRAHNCILDGEIMVWKEDANCWAPFEDMRSILDEMSDRKKEKEKVVEERYSLKFCVFDMLYVEQKGSTTAEAASAGTRADSKCDGSLPDAVGSIQMVEHSGPFEITTLSQTHGENILSSAKRKKSKLSAKHSLVEYSLSVRKKLLASIVTDYSSEFADGLRSCVSLVEGVRGWTDEDLVKGLGDFVQKGYEGLVAKSPEASYGMGERKPDMAIKLKPDYFEGGLQDIDVVILAGKYGTGSGQKKGRVGEISSFLIGVRTENSKEELLRYQRNEVCKWTPVGAIGTGYNLQQLKELQRRLEPHWHELVDTSDREKFPSFWDSENQADTMFSDLAKWIDPRDSVVLNVRAYELARRQGCALRFPRCNQIRYSSEKPFYDAISLDELKELDDCKKPAVVSSSGGQDDEEVVEEVTSSKKRKRTYEAKEIADAQARHTTMTRAGGASKVRDATCEQAYVSDIKEKDRLNVFKHGDTRRCFRVLAQRGQGAEKQDWERSLYRLGASLTQNDFDKNITDIVALDAEHKFVRKARADSTGDKKTAHCTHSILRTEWLAECERTSSDVPPKRKHVFFANEELETELSRHTDRYGDPWTPTTTSASLLASFAEMDVAESRGELLPSPAADDTDIEESVKKGMRAAGIYFWGILAYFPSKGESSHFPASTSTQAFMRIYGCEVITSLEDGKTPSHVVLPDHCPLEEQTLISEKVHSAVAVDVALVSISWAHRCVEERRLLSPFVKR